VISNYGEPIERRSKYSVEKLFRWCELARLVERVVGK